LTHRDNEGAGAHVLPAESGQQLSSTKNGTASILSVFGHFCLSGSKSTDKSTTLIISLIF
jgi:hypothetical protein